MSTEPVANASLAEQIDGISDDDLAAYESCEGTPATAVFRALGRAVRKSREENERLRRVVRQQREEDEIKLAMLTEFREKGTVEFSRWLHCYPIYRWSLEKFADELRAIAWHDKNDAAEKRNVLLIAENQRLNVENASLRNNALPFPQP